MAKKKNIKKKNVGKKNIKRKNIKKKLVTKKPVGKKKKTVLTKKIRILKMKAKPVKTKKRKKINLKKKAPRIIRKKKVLKKIKIKPVSREVDATVHKTRIRVIGIGGGGSTIVSEISSRVKKADFWIANTDIQALKKSPKGVKRFQFGQELTRGLGTGMNAELGEQAAQTEEEKIKKLLEGQDLSIFIASLGGGTSSGASPVFSKISKNLGNITFGIFTLPFKFEGEKKMEMALEALEKIKPHLNVYTVIPNERIFRIIDKNTPLNDALSAINKSLSDNLEGLIEMVYLPGLINIDFADLRTILSGRGRLTYLSTIEVEGPNKEEAIKKLISSPLYPYDIKGSRGILYNITSGKNIQLNEVNQISSIVSESVNKNAKIIFGINQSPKYKDKTKITLLASGCTAKGFLSPLKIKEEEKIKSKLRKRKKYSKIKKISEKINKLVNPEKKASPVKKLSAVQKPVENIKPIVKKKVKPKVSSDLVNREKLIPKKTFPLSENKPVVLNHPTTQFSEMGGKIRKNALQVRKEAEEAEKELLDREKIWEIPAILRRNDDQQR